LTAGPIAGQVVSDGLGAASETAAPGAPAPNQSIAAGTSSLPSYAPPVSYNASGQPLAAGWQQATTPAADGANGTSNTPGTPVRPAAPASPYPTAVAAQPITVNVQPVGRGYQQQLEQPSGKNRIWIGVLVAVLGFLILCCLPIILVLVTTFGALATLG
jgi:hypothetical protein